MGYGWQEGGCSGAVAPAGSVDGDASGIVSSLEASVGVFDLPLVVALAGSAAVSEVDVALSWRPCSGVAACFTFLYCSFSEDRASGRTQSLFLFSFFLYVFGYVFFSCLMKRYAKLLHFLGKKKYATHCSQ